MGAQSDRGSVYDGFYVDGGYIVVEADVLVDTGFDFM